MKVHEVINDLERIMITESFDFNQLTSLHIAALKAISENRLDFDNASDRMMDVVYELVEEGLINEDYSLAEPGIEAIRLAKELGGSKERRQAARKPFVDVDQEDAYTDPYSKNYALDGDESKFSMNRYGTDNPHV